MSGARRSHTSLRRSLAALVAVSCLALGACQNKSAQLDGADPMATGSTGAPSLKETAKLGKSWQKDPKNLRLGLAYAVQLERLGQKNQQLQVLATLAQHHPKDPTLLSIYGRELTQAGQPDQAHIIFRKRQEIPAVEEDFSLFDLAG